MVKPIILPNTKRIRNLEETADRRTLFEEISTTSGAVALSSGFVVVLDSWSEDIDALVLVLAVSGQQPENVIPRDSNGDRVVVTSFDTSGNYQLSGTPYDRENDTEYNQWAIAYVGDISEKDFRIADIRGQLLT